MPAPQHAAYEATVAGARDAGTPGAMLSALSTLRRISLHPDPESTDADADFIGASARLVLLFRALDDISNRQEKALIFLDDRTMQAVLLG